MKESEIIMWTETDPNKRKRLQDMLRCATFPISDASKSFRWEGDNLITDLDCDKTHWQNMYFYLSGYGDTLFALGEDAKKEPATDYTNP